MLLQDNVRFHCFETPLWLFYGAGALLLLSCADPGTTPAASAGSGVGASSTVEAKGALYNLFFRDTIPYENDKGLLRAPTP